MEVINKRYTHREPSITVSPSSIRMGFIWKEGWVSSCFLLYTINTLVGGKVGAINKYYVCGMFVL